MTDTPKPTEINLHKKSRILEITYADGEHFELSCEFLRVHSPSAEVQECTPPEFLLATVHLPPRVTPHYLLIHSS